jgi:hypothetical protein
VQELCSKGYSQREASISSDMQYLRNQAKTNIRKYNQMLRYHIIYSVTKKVITAVEWIIMIETRRR